jgi:UDP-N-acetylmuramate dehydrogenase
MIEAQTDVPLSEWCTLGVGGPARWFIRARSEDELIDSLAWGDARRAPVLVLGGGSNVVIADEGFPGLVVQVAIAGVDTFDERTQVLFRAGAGESWDPFVARTVADNCAGLECLSGIPGLVGGTPVQNVGAYGQDVSGTIRSVRVLDRHTRRVEVLSNQECGFGYRTSRFKHADATRFIVTEVDFALRRDAPPTITYTDVVTFFAQRGGESPTLDEVRNAIIEIRSRKGMVIRDGNPANRSCGSFFVNPVVTRARWAAIGDAPHYAVNDSHVKIPAAWLIEQAGFPRGYVDGPVGISPFQAQGLINRGGATASDVVGLALAIKRAVRNRFGIALVPEPVFVGFRDDPGVRWLLERQAND